MTLNIYWFFAAYEVAGSCHLVPVGNQWILLDRGPIRGGRKDGTRKRELFPVDSKSIDAVVLSHTHIDHSRRLPLLVKVGCRGSIYTHRACRDLCRIIFKDTGFLMPGVSLPLAIWSKVAPLS